MAIEGSEADDARGTGAQYMDRIYVKHQNKAPVTQLGLDLWRDCVVRRKGIRDRMLGMVLDLIHRERTGEIVDRALLRSITTVPPSAAPPPSAAAPLACLLDTFPSPQLASRRSEPQQQP
jgi:hypothetical protein